MPEHSQLGSITSVSITYCICNRKTERSQHASVSLCPTNSVKYLTLLLW